MSPETIQKYVDLMISMAVQYVPNVILALLTLWIGFILVRSITHSMGKVLHTRHMDPTVSVFLESLVSIVLKILVLVSVATMVGIQMTSFIAVFGAATLAIGLSLQGSLSNLAGGLLILFLKHFRVGDDIEAQGQRGTVGTIEIFTTILNRPDGSTAIIPNGILSNGVIINHSRKK